MSRFGSYSGDELLELKLKTRDWLVDRLIKEKDSVMLLGQPKAGKSLLKQQLIFSLTSQHPFLDKYEVSKECRVTDIQLEGELEDTQDRFKRMMNSEVDFIPKNYQLIFEAPMRLHSTSEIKGLIKRIDNFHIPETPDVIFIDPLYLAFSGSLSEDTVVRQFLGNLRILKNHFDCAIVLIHHTHKIRINQKTGEMIDEGDEALFGSQFLKAYPDHILLFSYDKQNEIRVLSCTTQRSGNVDEKTVLKLVQPMPLYFEEIEGGISKEKQLYDIIVRSEHKDGIISGELQRLSGLGKTTFARSIKKLLIRFPIIGSKRENDARQKWYQLRG